VRRSYPLGYLAAMVVDAMGSGMWIPFSLLFFTYGRGMRIAEAGAALTTGSLVSLLAGGLLAGTIVDRIGAFRSAALSALTRAVAFPCYLAGHGFAWVATIAVAVSFADRLFWAGHGEMVSAVAESEEARVGLFSLLNALRNIGLGVGALTASLGAWAEHGSGIFWTIIILVNASSYAISGIPLWRLRRLDHVGTDNEDSGMSRYRDMFTQYRFLLFVAAAAVLALADVAFDSMLPVYLLSVGLSAWVPPIAYLMSCVLIPCSAPLASAVGRRMGGLNALAMAAALVAFAYVALTAIAVCTVGSAPLLAVAVTLFSVATALMGATAVNVMLSFAPAGRSGRHAAVYQFSWGIVSAIGPGLFAWLFSLERVLPWVFLVIALVIVAAVFRIILRATRQEAQASEGAST
jgi:hypothetical protein